MEGELASAEGGGRSCMVAGKEDRAGRGGGGSIRVASEEVVGEADGTTGDGLREGGEAGVSETGGGGYFGAEGSEGCKGIATGGWDDVLGNSANSFLAVSSRTADNEPYVNGFLCGVAGSPAASVQSA